MSRDTQIAEMARIAYEIEIFDKSDAKIAVDEGLLDSLLNLYNSGYRKSQDVAEEIFAEIESSIANIKYTVDSPRYTHIPVETMVEVCNWILQKCIPKRLAELKNKYTEEK